MGQDQTAVYDAEGEHTLLRYDNGVITYILVKAE